MNPSSSSNSLMTVTWIVVAFVLLVVGGLIIARQRRWCCRPRPRPRRPRSTNLSRSCWPWAAPSGCWCRRGRLLRDSLPRPPGRQQRRPSIHGNSTLEFIWTLIPAITVIILSIISFQVWVNITSARDNEQLVQTRGARFLWSFSYDIPGEQQSVNSPVLHTWVGQPVVLSLQTADVNHSFWVPSMRIKQDLLAGRRAEARFTPVLAGEFPVVCAELCGSGHGDMRSTTWCTRTRRASSPGSMKSPTASSTRRTIRPRAVSC